MLPCPFCGKQNDITDPDTLHRSGIYWRITDSIKHYVTFKYRLPSDNAAWEIHCAEVNGGCGAEITRDSREECIDAWNKRSLK